MTLRGCFVTGTDTEVGKTRVSAGLLYWLGQAGVRAAGYKPVASGIELLEGRRVNEDVLRLQQASSVALSDEQVGPCQLGFPCAPHIAAELEGRVIDRQALALGAHELQRQADCIVAEGAGGLLVPLGPDWDSSDLMVELGLPVVLVVGLRLGCISHALLSAEAIVARGLRLSGWVANTLDPAMPQLSRNIETLRHELSRRHQAPCLGQIPYLKSSNAASVAAHFDPAALRNLFGLAPAQFTSLEP
jgi:dethiobiotin synthetase